MTTLTLPARISIDDTASQLVDLGYRNPQVAGFDGDGSEHWTHLEAPYGCRYIKVTYGKDGADQAPPTPTGSECHPQDLGGYCCELGALTDHPEHCGHDFRSCPDRAEGGS